MTTIETTEPECKRARIGRLYASLTREYVVEHLARLEAKYAMPDDVAALFDSEREWEALRLWCDLLQVAHPARPNSLDTIRRERVARCEAIRDRACAMWGIDLKLLQSNRRGVDGILSKVRKVIAKACSDLTGATSPEIAYVIRGFSYKHATILDALNTWQFTTASEVVVQMEHGIVIRTLGDLYAQLCDTCGAGKVSAA